MKKYIYLFLVLILLGWNNTGNAYAGMISSFDTGFKLSQIESKDLVVMFSSNSCYYCRKFEKETFSDTVVQKLLRNNAIFVRLLLEDRGHKLHYKNKVFTYVGFAGAFGIKGTPTFIFFGSDGNPITAYPGYAPPGIFVKVLRYIFQRLYRRKVKFSEYYKKNDDFLGKQEVKEITKQEAEFVLRNDPYARLLRAKDNIEVLDRSMRYVVCRDKIGKDAVEKMKELGFFTIFKTTTCPEWGM